MKKSLLIYAHYYIPDVASTGQILRELAEGMLDSFDITVICVVPSYDGKIDSCYKDKKVYKENINGVKVYRVRVPEFSKADKASRVNNIVAYYEEAKWLTRKLAKHNNYDYVFSISQPPVLGGMLGAYGKKVLRTRSGAHPKFIYNIQDFNPEQIMAVNYSHNKVVLDAMMYFDKKSCEESDLVITVGRDLIDTLRKRFNNHNVPKCALINNWSDENAVYPLEDDNEKVHAFREKYGLLDKFVIMYSGNIGLYYDLEHIIKVIKKFRKGYDTNGVYHEGIKSADGREVVFAFVGNGSRKPILESYKERHQIENIVFIPYQAKEDLIYSLNAADVHWCVNAKGIKGVSCPSKAYGIMSVAKPIIGILEENTEIRNIIDECNCGRCCDPGDYNKVADIIQWYIENAGTNEVKEMGRNGRMYLKKNLTKDISVRKYIEEIQNC